MTGLPPVSSSPLAYEGSIAIPYIIRNFAPTTANNTFAVPTLWIDPLDGLAWILLGKALGVADWALIASAEGDITSIYTPDGNTALPLAGVINFLNGTGMNITSVNDSNNITFNSIGGGFSWTDVTAATQTLAPGNGYVADGSSQIAFSLPATAAFGDSYSIVGLGTGGWTISQGAGQSIIVGNVTSTTGVGGSVSSTLQSDCIVLLCVTANTTFKMIDSTGNLTVV